MSGQGCPELPPNCFWELGWATGEQRHEDRCSNLLPVAGQDPRNPTAALVFPLLSGLNLSLGLMLLGNVVEQTRPGFRCCEHVRILVPRAAPETLRDITRIGLGADLACLAKHRVPQ